MPSLVTSLLKGGSHVYLFHGPFGTGKTTLARLSAMLVNCEDPEVATKREPCLECNSCKAILAENCMDVLELNAADKSGKEDMGAVVDGMRTYPFQSKKKVYIIDESHELSKAAQSKLLKPTEDVPEHIYFFFCSSDLKKMNEAIGQRCFKVHTKLMKDKDLERLVDEVCIAEHPQGNSIKEKRPDLLKQIVVTASGSVRSALQNLEKVLSGGLDLEIKFDEEETPEIVRTLYGYLKEKEWRKISPFIKGMGDLKSDVEDSRFRLACYARACLLSDPNATNMSKNAAILSAFKDPMFGRDAFNQFVAKLYELCR